MSDSSFSLDAKAIGGSFVIGLIFVVLFTWMNGNAFGTPTFPLFAMTSGFILAGFAYGLLSEGETVLEPAAAAVLVAAVSYFIIDGLQLEAFQGLAEGEFTKLMITAFLNGLVLTFAGAWAGEKLQRTYATDDAVSSLRWGWMVAGVILGIAVSLFLTNVVIFLYGLASSPYAALEPSNVWVLLFVVFLGLEATGYVCTFRSPGDTSYEAVVAGLITLVLLIDVFIFALGGMEILTYGRLALFLAVGLIASMVGGYVGEQMQMRVEPSQAAPQKR